MIILSNFSGSRVVINWYVKEIEKIHSDIRYSALFCLDAVLWNLMQLSERAVDSVYLGVPSDSVRHCRCYRVNLCVRWNGDISSRTIGTRNVLGRHTCRMRVSLGHFCLARDFLQR